MNRPGVIFCAKCGTNLRTGASPLSTKALDQESGRKLERPIAQPSSAGPSEAETRGTDVFPQGGSLRLEVEGSPDPIQLHFTHQEIVLGRRDPATGALPDVDLTPFAGYRMGVSRRHSEIRYNEGHLHILDLGSSNGTFLNGKRLDAHYPYRLHDGDRVGLGQIVIRVFFQQPVKATAAKAKTETTRVTPTAPDKPKDTGALGKPAEPKPTTGPVGEKPSGVPTDRFAKPSLDKPTAPSTSPPAKTPGDKTDSVSQPSSSAVPPATGVPAPQPKPPVAPKPDAGTPPEEAAASKAEDKGSPPRPADPGSSTKPEEEKKHQAPAEPGQPASRATGTPPSEAAKKDQPPAGDEAKSPGASDQPGSSDKSEE
ncbi:MAG: FHA domain-containing protein [Chloroflexi bacterium]|nr:FHA domain-containing protein [Chloroflexota bacterium]